MIIQSKKGEGNHYESMKENSKNSKVVQRQYSEPYNDSLSKPSTIKTQIFQEEMNKLIESGKKNQGLTYNEALLAAGGFGRFQWFTSFFMIMLYNSSGYLFYGLAYLELYPVYKCPTDIPKCDHTDKCRDPSIQVDWSNDKSLHNWVEKLDLTCAKPFQVGLIGSMFFAGWTAACIIVPRIGDIYGRKWIVFFSQFQSFVVYLALILSQNLNFSIVMMFFLGLTSVAKVGTSYVYLLELVPQKSVTAISTIVLFADGSTMIWISLYYKFISNEWLYLQIFGITITGLSNVTMLLMPESPKFFYSIKKYDLARKSLRYIARFNKVQDYEDCVFDTEFQEIMLQTSNAKQQEVKDQGVNLNGTDQDQFKALLNHYEKENLDNATAISQNNNEAKDLKKQEEDDKTRNILQIY
ncbi:solute carrier family member 5 [Stylonychia lemnae]|uniref:Solute carrier family member 5 n=1 Tax=Stylonychia lemnae TaxID=5949 RepID=A0A078A8M0_STYLE|nr:solute carrier family member 5 [Stylonychia lemnae]|eukprot:CDW78574.1 solute carrier family member 5 [Stylonychia lemnae]